MGNIVSPGFAIFKTWQGIAEMILRVACIVLSFIVLICASVVTGAINNIDDLEERDTGVENNNSGRYRSAAGWLIFVAVMGIIIQTIVIIIRFLNISFINQNFLLFGFIDVAISAVFVLSLFAGATANAAYAADNADTHDKQCSDTRFSNDDQEEACDNLGTVRNAEGASAAFGYFAMVAYGLLAGIILYVLITQYINKPKSSDPSSNYQESDPNAEPI